MEVVEGLYCLDAGQGVNVYLWRPADSRDDGAPLLFDCGWPWSGRRLVAGLAGLDVRPGQIRAIAVTHDDFDHSGRLVPLQAVSGAQIIAHEAEVSRLSSDTWRSLPQNGRSSAFARGIAKALYAPWPRHGVRVSRPVQDGAELPGGWVVVHTPGHTPGHASYFHPRLGVAIVGDALGSPRSSALSVGRRPAARDAAQSSAEPDGVLRPPARIYAEDWEEAVRSVCKLAELSPAVLCVGHGPVVRNAEERLRRLAATLQSLSGKDVLKSP